MKLRRWIDRRGTDFIRRRAYTLIKRYGLTPARAETRIRSTVDMLAEHGCSPTFPTPGRVVDWHPGFIKSLQDRGVEIAVHSYDHLDLKGYSPAEAGRQLLKGAEVCERHGIEVHGFRCPYLSLGEGVLEALPAGRFGYSSNESVLWEASVPAEGGGPFFETIARFYEPQSTRDTCCTPHARNGLVEIPVFVPDDLLLHDGLHLNTEQMAAAWIEMLDYTYRQGAAFTLMFHPELAELCMAPLSALLREAARAAPQVWIARLRDIAEWWREKASFGAEVVRYDGGWRVKLSCSQRATVLTRGLPGATAAAFWWETYERIQPRVLEVPGNELPLVGVPADTPAGTVSYLREQGYIVMVGELGEQCATYLDSHLLATLGRGPALLAYVEGCTGPLVRYWRWPDGARSALSVTGDLDALILLDYAPRLWAR